MKKLGMIAGATMLTALYAVLAASAMPYSAEEFNAEFIKGIGEAAVEADIRIPVDMKNWEIPLYLVKELKADNAKLREELKLLRKGKRK